MWIMQRGESDSNKIDIVSQINSSIFYSCDFYTLYFDNYVTGPCLVW